MRRQRTKGLEWGGFGVLTGFTKIPSLLDLDRNDTIQYRESAWLRTRQPKTWDKKPYDKWVPRYTPKTLSTILSSLRFKTGILAVLDVTKIKSGKRSKR
jgi:hypothetical protein